MITKAHVTDQGLGRVVEKQLRRWELAAQQSPGADGVKTGPVWGFVALSNQVGAGGDDVAAALGEKLGWPVFDKEILHYMAGDDEVRAHLYKSMDERDLGWVEESFRAMMQQEFRRNDYLHQLTQTVMLLARRGPAIFLGRGVDMILPPGPGVRVQVIASRRRRIQNFAQRTGMTPEQAAVEIDRIEQERRDFMRRDFRADADDPTRFDLLINVERIRPQDAAKLIETALALRTARAGSES